MAKVELTEQIVHSTANSLFQGSSLNPAERSVAERVTRYALRGYRDVMPASQFVDFVRYIGTAVQTFDIFIPDPKVAEHYGEGFLNPYNNYPVYDTRIPRNKQGSDRFGKLLGRIKGEDVISFSQSMASAIPFWEVTRQIQSSNIKVGDKVNILDLCGAPGNKTLNFLHLPSVSEITAVINDHKPARLKRVEERLTDELGFMPKEGGFFRKFNGRKATIYLSYADASNPDEVKRLTNRFFRAPADIVIADVDCPGDGRIATDMNKLLNSAGSTKPWPSFAIQTYPRSMKDVVLQTRILKAALGAVSDRGVVAYSTCSVNPFVNEAVVDAVLSEVGGFRSLDLAPDNKHMFPALTEFQEEVFSDGVRGVRTYPNTLGEGFYCSLIQAV